MMKAAVVALLLATSSLAVADEAPPPKITKLADGVRVVPAMKDGKLQGLKLYAIRPNTRLANEGLANGDTITNVDGVSVLEEAGWRALVDNVIDGKADATVSLIRRGQPTSVTTKKQP